jgi:hypothetical protein
MNDDEKIDLRALLAEANRQWWIASGEQARVEKALYDALLSAAPSVPSEEKK